MRPCWGGGGEGEGVLIPYPCKSKRRYALSLNVVRTLLLKVRENAGGGAGGKTCPFPRIFCGKEKKMLATIFFSYIHVKNKEGITVAEKMQ